MTFKIIDNEHTAKIKVVGVGGAGGNAINRMVASGMHGVEFIAINTDGQVLETSVADLTLCIGDSITHGLGAGAKPELGRQAIEADRENVAEKLVDTDLVFITAGMGGGTGTGAAPIVAEIAREQGALTVGIVTEPFDFEGFPRMRNATNGIAELLDRVDTLIVIKNQRLLSICSRDTTLEEAFLRADEVLLQATRGIADLITIPGMINLDFMDVRTIITEGGDAIMGVGTHRGENRALEAAKKAIKSPLLEDVSIEGAKGVLINISSGSNLTLFEVNEATSVVHEAAGQEANIIFGTVIDDGLIDEIRVTVIATGFNIIKEETVEQPQDKISTNPEDEGVNRDIPTFIRRNRNSPAAGSRQGKAEEERQATPEKLEYPTFLRRKMSG